MEVHTTDEATAKKENKLATEPVSNKFDSVQSFGSDEDTVIFSRSPGEVLTRVELDLACLAEKLVNLNILVLHVGMRESDYEAYVSSKDHELSDKVLKALQFDLLSGVLDWEVREIDSFLSTIQSDIVHIREFVSSYDPGQSAEGIEDKIHACEESLKQSIDQLSEIKAQSAKFQRILSSCNGEESEEEDKSAPPKENGDFINPNEKVKLQTAEQQRHFLTMLEKSLAREMELEIKVCELKQIDEELKLKLHSSEQEAFFMEEEALLVWERLFEAENASDILMGISQETLRRVQHVQLNSNGSSELEKKPKSEDLKESVFKTRAESAERECNLLCEANVRLNEELAILRAKRDESEKVEILKGQLQEYDLQLQHALASADATEEKQRILYDTINDMESIIQDLKSRVSRAEIRAEGVENNCIKLSDTNADLNEEISCLRDRLECVEKSLRKSEETKMETAKDIGIRTKVISNLVMQLAFERERLHNQISLLTKDKKLRSRQIVKDPLGTLGHDDKVTSKSYLFSGKGCDTTAHADESKEESDVSTTTDEMGKMRNRESGAEEETKLETVRNIDARQINYKYVFVAALAVGFSLVTGFLINHTQGYFQFP